MACGACRARMAQQRPKAVRTATESPCQKLEVSRDDTMLEISPVGELIIRAPYNATLSTARTMTVLGCRTMVAEELRQVEAAVMTMYKSDALKARFKARLGTDGLVNLGSIKQALASI